MKKVNKILSMMIILFLLFVITGCDENKKKLENNQTQQEQKEKLLLELPHHIDIQEENEKTLKRTSEVINIQNLKFENIKKSNLKEYANKYQIIIEYIKSKYSAFDVNKWNIMINMYSEDGYGILKMNYVINDKIETNKSIFFTIENNNIVLASFINIDLEADEKKVFEEIEKFESIYEQQKKIFASNEEFKSEETYYTYYYNLDKLVYTYQLYFYEEFDGVKIENNSYVSEYIVNETGILLEV